MNYLTFPLLIPSLIFGFKHKVNPPGTIKLTESLFIDKNPIANIDWLEYLFVNWNGYVNTNIEVPYLDPKDSCNFIFEEIYVEKSKKLLKSNEHLQFYLDTILYENTNRKRVGITGNGKGYFALYYPVLGITIDEAKDYCEWRTKVVLYIYAKEKKRKRERYFTQIKYRLPTNEELEFAKEKYKSHSSEGFYITKPKVDLKHLNNKFEELTLDEDEINNDKKYGFRCVCEIIKK